MPAWLLEAAKHRQGKQVSTRGGQVKAGQKEGKATQLKGMGQGMVGAAKGWALDIEVKEPCIQEPKRGKATEGKVKVVFCLAWQKDGQWAEGSMKKAGRLEGTLCV